MTSLEQLATDLEREADTCWRASTTAGSPAFRQRLTGRAEGLTRAARKVRALRCSEDSPDARTQDAPD